MSEPPEDRDETAANADLEELLEQFRETEEPRPKAPRPLWSILAMVLAVLALVLALRIGTGRSGEKRSAGELSAPALPTKAWDREPRMDVGKPVDALAEYIARGERGMTEREVGWIVEDFQKAGLDQELGIARAADHIARRRLAQRWYLDALAEGLHLTVEQRHQAGENLAVLMDQATAEFNANTRELPVIPATDQHGEIRVVDGNLIHRLVDAREWMKDDRFAPWELCDLTADQRRITWRDIIEAIRNDVTGESGRGWLEVPEFSSVVQTPRGTLGIVRRNEVGDGEKLINETGVVLTFQAFGLKSGNPSGDLVQQVMDGHPSQLKIALLLRPELAAELADTLEARSE